MTRDEFVTLLNKECNDRCDIPEEKRLSKRNDMHAFILLDRLAPMRYPMVAAAEHDQIWLGVDVDAVAAAVTEEDVRQLAACFVHYDDDVSSLSMFV